MESEGEKNESESPQETGINKKLAAYQATSDQDFLNKCFVNEEKTDEMFQEDTSEDSISEDESTDSTIEEVISRSRKPSNLKFCA